MWRIDKRRQMVYAKVQLPLGMQQTAAETLQNKAVEEEKTPAQTQKRDVDDELSPEVSEQLARKVEELFRK
jgi:hypothetical protein